MISPTKQDESLPWTSCPNICTENKICTETKICIGNKIEAPDTGRSEQRKRLRWLIILQQIDEECQIWDIYEKERRIACSGWMKTERIWGLQRKACPLR